MPEINWKRQYEDQRQIAIYHGHRAAEAEASRSILWQTMQRIAMGQFADPEREAQDAIDRSLAATKDWWGKPRGSGE